MPIPDIRKLNLKKFNFSKKIKPALAVLVDKPPRGDNWIHEMKFDGYRLICMIDKSIRIFTRNQNDWTDKFGELVAALKKTKLKDAVLDGEIVAHDEKGKPSFQALQNTLSDEANGQLIYYVFDLIAYQGYDLTSLDILTRKAILKKAITKADKKIIRYSDHIKGNGEKTFDNACKLGFEGIVCKSADSIYLQRRTRDWLKVKCTHRQEFVIGGFTKPRGSRAYFGALLLGFYEKGKFKYCGRVGTGFNEASLKSLYGELKKNICKTSPFDDHIPGRDIKAWVKPKLVVEVEFTEWTEEGSLRHPSFKGIRKDKKASAVVREDK